MSFEEKSTGAMLATHILVFGWYFIRVIGAGLASPTAPVDYQSFLLSMVVVFIVLAIVSHIVIAALAPRDAEAGEDERDRLIAMRGSIRGGWVLALGVFGAMTEAGLNMDGFWIAHTLLAALVLSEITRDIAKLIAYGRGF